MISKLNSLYQQTYILLWLIMWLLCLPVLHVCMPMQHRWGFISLVPLEENQQRERRDDRRWQRTQLLLSDLFLFSPTDLAKLVTFFFSFTYHNPIFIWHNGPICLLLTYAMVSLHSSNHWKLTGCCVCFFHYWGEDKDLGHFTSFPFMNLNESDRIFDEHEMHWKLLMVRELAFGENSKCRNISLSIMTYQKSESGEPSQIHRKKEQKDPLISAGFDIRTTGWWSNVSHESVSVFVLPRYLVPKSLCFLNGFSLKWLK